MMIKDEHTGQRRPMNLNERAGVVVIFVLIIGLCIGLFYALVTGQFDASPSVFPTPTSQPNNQRIIRQVGTEAIPVDTPIEFYIERGKIRWREFIPEETP